MGECRLFDRRENGICTLSIRRLANALRSRTVKDGVLAVAVVVLL
jgi:hypothetical protein